MGFALLDSNKSSFQSDAVANHFELDGYFIALVAFVITPNVPFSRFVRIQLLCAFGTCLGAACALFAIWSAIKARQHTTSPNSMELYNSSQAAVLGVWLVFYIWAAYSYKSAYPSMTYPVLIFGLTQVATLAPGVAYRTMDIAITSQVKLLEAFLLGLGLSFAVGVVVFPQSCRGVFFDSVRAYVKSMRAVLVTQASYFQTLERHEQWSATSEGSHPEHATQKKALAGLYGNAIKIREELKYAKGEIMVGKLDGDDIASLSERLLRVMPALTGLAYVIDLIHKTRHTSAPSRCEISGQGTIEKGQAMLQSLHEPAIQIRDAMDHALAHILIMLELEKRSEADAGLIDSTIGTPKFLEWYDERTQAFAETRHLLSQLWLDKTGDAMADFNAPDQMRRLSEKIESAEETSSVDHIPFAIIYVSFSVVTYGEDSTNNVVDIIPAPCHESRNFRYRRAC